MDNWAAYLRGQADALHLPVIDTTVLAVDQVADRLENEVRQLIEPHRPKPNDGST